MSNALSRLEQFYIPITRADPETRVVEGYCFTTPTVKGDKWNLKRSALEKASRKYMEMPAVRAMHGPVAAGKAISLMWDATGCLLRAEIVDDNEWRKVEKGVYRGFSIGGRPTIARGNEVDEFEWVETSLVDRPCDPGARFTVARVDDGEVEDVPVIELPADASDEAVEMARGELDNELERRAAKAPKAPQGHWVTHEGRHVFISDRYASADHVFAAGVAHDLGEDGHAELEKAHQRGDLPTTGHLHMALAEAKKLQETGTSEVEAVKEGVRKHGYNGTATHAETFRTAEEAARRADDARINVDAVDARRAAKERFQNSGMDIKDYVYENAGDHDDAQAMAASLGYHSTTWDDARNQTRRQKQRDATVRQGVLAGRLTAAKRAEDIEPLDPAALLRSAGATEDEINELLPLLRFDPNQPRADDGEWTIIAGEHVSIPGRAAVSAEDVEKAADKYGVKGDAKAALVQAQKDGKITDESHMLRAIAHTVHHGGSKVEAERGIEKHGVGGSHEHKYGGWEKDAAAARAKDDEDAAKKGAGAGDDMPRDEDLDAEARKQAGDRDHDGKRGSAEKDGGVGKDKESGSSGKKPKSLLHAAADLLSGHKDLQKQAQDLAMAILESNQTSRPGGARRSDGEDLEVERYASSQPRDDQGMWTVIGGHRVSIEGKKATEKSVHMAALRFGVSNAAHAALIRAHEDGKIQTDNHLLRSIAHLHESAGGAGKATKEHADAAITAHGKGGSHENRWHREVTEKDRSAPPLKQGKASHVDFDDKFRFHVVDEYGDKMRKQGHVMPSRENPVMHFEHREDAEKKLHALKSMNRMDEEIDDALTRGLDSMTAPSRENLEGWRGGNGKGADGYSVGDALQWHTQNMVDAAQDPKNHPRILQAIAAAHGVMNGDDWPQLGMMPGAITHAARAEEVELTRAELLTERGNVQRLEGDVNRLESELETARGERDTEQVKRTDVERVLAEHRAMKTRPPLLSTAPQGAEVLQALHRSYGVNEMLGTPGTAVDLKAQKAALEAEADNELDPAKRHGVVLRLMAVLEKINRQQAY